MLNKYRTNTVRDLFFDIESVTTGVRKDNRFALADVYQMTLSAEPFFPPKPFSLLITTPSNLRRKVDAGCSSCVNPSTMLEYVEQSKRTLLEYKLSLQKWLEERKIGFDEKGEIITPKVHDLGSTIKKH